MAARGAGSEQLHQNQFKICCRAPAPQFGVTLQLGVTLRDASVVWQQTELAQRVVWQQTELAHRVVLPFTWS